MIGFLLDQGLPRSAVSFLVGRGYDVLHVADVGLREAEDMEIIQYARQHERVIVTLDADFHALLKVGGYSTPSVIRLRLEGLNGGALAEIIEQVATTAGDDLEKGALVTVGEKTIRIHRL